jgi:hypothetical protein
MEYLVNNIILFIFLFINIIFLIYFLIYLTNKKSSSSDNYSILMHVLQTIVTNYKEQVYSIKYENLLHSHDLEKDSPTNSKKIFDKTAEDLLSYSCKDILNNYISEKILKELTNYYTINSIISIIIKLLKE